MSESLPRAERLEQKRSFWKQHIDSWEKSGLTQAEYCRRLQLKPHQMAYWKKQFYQSEAQAEFVPIQLSPLMAPAEPCECKLHIPLCQDSCHLLPEWPQQGKPPRGGLPCCGGQIILRKFNFGGAGG